MKIIQHLSQLEKSWSNNSKEDRGLEMQPKDRSEDMSQRVSLQLIIQHKSKILTLFNLKSKMMRLFNLAAFALAHSKKVRASRRSIATMQILKRPLLLSKPHRICSIKNASLNGFSKNLNVQCAEKTSRSSS